MFLLLYNKDIYNEVYAVTQVKQVLVYFLDHCEWFSGSKTFHRSLSYCLYLFILLENKSPNNIAQKLYELVRNIQFTWRYLALQKRNHFPKDRVS